MINMGELLIMERVRGMYRFSFEGDTQDGTFIWVEGHLPLTFPFHKLMEILLEDLGVQEICDLSIDDSVVCKQSRF